MLERGRLAVVAAVCAGGCGALVGCSSPQEQRYTCDPLSPGRYTFALTYAGEYTFDGGCPSGHTFDGQTVTVVLDRGAATVIGPTQTLSCWLTGDGTGLEAHCPLPPGNDQLKIGLSPSCGDSGVRATVSALDGIPDAGMDDLSAACVETYSAQ
jgi:hypothetical protein